MSYNSWYRYRYNAWPWRSHPQEYCTTVEDFIMRRTRMAFLDAGATEAAIPRVRRVSCLLLAGHALPLHVPPPHAHTYTCNMHTQL